MVINFPSWHCNDFYLIFTFVQQSLTRVCQPTFSVGGEGSHLYAIVRRLAVEIRYGEAGGFAHRLGERELGLCHCVSASRFCLQLSWNGHLPKTHVPRMPVDVATLRHRFYVLDLLPAPLAPADSRQVGHGGIRRDFTQTMATGDPS